MCIPRYLNKSAGEISIVLFKAMSSSNSCWLFINTFMNTGFLACHVILLLVKRLSKILQQVYEFDKGNVCMNLSNNNLISHQ